MSQVAIRAALETALAAMSPALTTSYENQSFTPPVASTPYQRAFVMFAEPENPTLGDGMYREQGIFQINLCYPLNAGDSTARARAALIKSTFPRGSSFVNGGVSVIVSKTPEASDGAPDGDRWVVPVKIRFYATITP